VPKAQEALESAPGVLAVQVDFESKQATVGTKKGEAVPMKDILAALEKINYRGRPVEGTP
jgi:hypothetical protein